MIPYSLYKIVEFLKFSRDFTTIIKILQSHENSERTQPLAGRSLSGFTFLIEINSELIVCLFPARSKYGHCWKDGKCVTHNCSGIYFNRHFNMMIINTDIHISQIHYECI